MLSTMMDYPLVLDRILDRAAAVFPRVELVSRRPDRSLARHTYTDLHKRAYALAAGLQRSGLREGDRVATLMWNHHAHLEAYFGVPLAGGVYHTLNLRLSPDELTGIATHAGDRFLIVDDVLLPLYLSFAEKVPFEKVWVVSANPSLELPPGVTLYEDLLAGGSADLKRLPDDEKRAAGLCYTSGTTGNPKGVLYSHRTLVRRPRSKPTIPGTTAGISPARSGSFSFERFCGSKTWLSRPSRFAPVSSSSSPEDAVGGCAWMYSTVARSVASSSTSSEVMVPCRRLIAGTSTTLL
jgi:acyl-CoA synthetase (AMP-forming)/AMP-acid ligase II